MKRSTMGALVLVLIALIAIGGLLTRPGNESAAGGGSAVADSLPRLAVLPFENRGPAEDEYFADGITDEVMARLARVGGIAVLAQRSAMQYKGSASTPEEIGRELGVDYILNSTISWQRTADGSSRVRIRPQLIRVSDGTQQWADVYDADLIEVFDVQSNLAEQVAGALGVAILEPERAAIARRPTENLRAYDHFLRGNHFALQRSRESVARAIEEYEAAVELDPTFAAAQARMAYAFGLFADWGWEYPGLSADSMLARGFDAVDRALELDPQSADAWMARAYLLVFRNTDTYAGVADAFEQALRHDPNNAEAHHQFGSMIVRLGEHEKADRHFHRALALEPTLAIALLNLGYDHMVRRQMSEATRYIDSAVAIDPGLAHTYEHRAQIRSLVGQHDAARADAELAIGATDGSLGGPILALVTARAGDTIAARAIIDQLIAEDPPLHREGRMWLIAALISIGDLEAAFERLEGTRDYGRVYQRYLTLWPEFDPVRDDPRFRKAIGEE